MIKGLKPIHGMLECSVPTFYRRIIRLAKVFPTSNRLGLLKSIKEEFHQNKKETDIVKIEHMVKHALQGYRQLQAYTTNLDTKKPAWNISLEDEYFVKQDPNKKYAPPPDLAAKATEHKKNWMTAQLKRTSKGIGAYTVERDDN